MPFTLLHMGPGLLIKAVAGPRFSVMTFGVAQIAMDIEPLIGILRGSSMIHGPTHTYLAALAIAAGVAAVAPALCRPALRRWHRELSRYRVNWLIASESFTPVATIAGAFTGTLSHVMFDSLMHADIVPLAPLSNANGLLGLISIDVLSQSCIFAGVFGLIGWVLGEKWRNRSVARNR